MRNQVLEFNLDSIDEIGIFGDRFEFFPSQLYEIGDQFEWIESLMVNRGVKSRKSEIKNQNKKGVQS